MGVKCSSDSFDVEGILGYVLMMQFCEQSALKSVHGICPITTGENTAKLSWECNYL